MATPRSAGEGGLPLSPALLGKPRSKAETIGKLSASRQLHPDQGGHDESACLFAPLVGDNPGRFELELFDGAMAAFQIHWKNEKLLDDFAFQSALRWYAAMHFFLGGSAFQKMLATKLAVTESSTSRWLNGLSAPLPRLRMRAMASAEELVSEVAKVRRSGANLADMTS